MDRFSSLFLRVLFFAMGVGLIAASNSAIGSESDDTTATNASQLERDVREPADSPAALSFVTAQQANSRRLASPGAIPLRDVPAAAPAISHVPGDSHDPAPVDEPAPGDALAAGAVAEPVASSDHATFSNPADGTTTTNAPATTAARRTAPRVASPRASTPVTATPTTTTAAPTTTTAAPTTTTAAPTTTAPSAAPPPPVSGNAGPSGTLGCQGECPQVGFQNLDGQRGVTLENAIISNPGGRCISMNNAHDIVLRNVTVTNCGTSSPVWDHYDTGLINIVNSSNIVIENSVISNISAKHHSGARNNAIQIKDSPNIRIVNNTFRDIHSDIGQRAGDKGNRAISVQGSSPHVSVERNLFANAGRNAIQVKQVRDAPGMSFSYNIVEGRGAWNSDYEDMVNLYSSSGRANDPFKIRGNYLRNGGPSPNGTAIIVGDGDAGKGSTQYVLVEQNVIVNPGNVGINLAGGDNITVRNNVVYGDQNVGYFETVGFIINHFGYSSSCHSHTVSGNRVWLRNQFHGSGVNHLWNTNTCQVNMFDNVFGDGSLSASVWNP